MREKTLTQKCLYRGRLLGLEAQDVELEDGRRAFREIVRHGPAVAILARRPDGRFVLVRQFRKPVESELLEAVAGNREPDEDAAVCARRELEEETGYRALSLVPLGFIYPSPGYVDERIDLFFAEVGDAAGAPRPDDDERLEPVLLTRDEVRRAIRDGTIHDGKTLAVWLRYELYSERTGDADHGTA